MPSPAHDLDNPSAGTATGMQAPSARADAEPASPGLLRGTFHTVYDIRAAQHALDSLPDDPRAEAQARLYQAMVQLGGRRLVGWPASSDPLAGVRDLCPNFSAIIDDLQSAVALASHQKDGFRMMPILLLGDPGVGKTFFAKQLATALGVPFQFLSMGSMSAGWVLSGSATTWQGAKQGLVANALIRNEMANAVFLLDELDKTGGDARYDPFGTLLQLLETDTARHFADEFLELEFDASLLTWVATANSMEAIPDYMLSRLAVYEVPSPTPAEAVHIGLQIYDQLREGFSWEFEPELDADVLEVLSMMAPREMKKRLLDAMGRAVSSHSNALRAADLRLRNTYVRPVAGFVR